MIEWVLKISVFGRLITNIEYNFFFDIHSGFYQTNMFPFSEQQQLSKMERSAFLREAWGNVPEMRVKYYGKALGHGRQKEFSYHQ